MSTPVARRVLIIGGAGLSGSFLCKRLVAAGDEVLCVDNLFTGKPPKVAHLLYEPGFGPVLHDISSPPPFEVGEICNLAHPASSIHYQPDHMQTKKTSVLGSVATLDLAVRVKAEILQSSTSELHDPAEGLAQTVEYFDGGPKRCAA